MHLDPILVGSCERVPAGAVVRMLVFRREGQDVSYPPNRVRRGSEQPYGEAAALRDQHVGGASQGKNETCMHRPKGAVATKTSQASSPR